MDSHGFFGHLGAFGHGHLVKDEVFVGTLDVPRIAPLTDGHSVSSVASVAFVGILISLVSTCEDDFGDYVAFIKHYCALISSYQLTIRLDNETTTLKKTHLMFWLCIDVIS